MTPPRPARFALLLAACLAPAAFGQAPNVAEPTVTGPPDQTAVPNAAPELVPLAAPTGGAGLFVGVNEFADPSGKVGNLRFAVNDAIEQCHLFALELRLIPPQNCTLALSGEPEGETATAHLAALEAAGATVVEARKSPILIALSQTCAKATGPSDLLIVACSSHGFSEGETAYLMPKDGLFEYLADTAVQLATVESRLRLSTAGHRMLLVDACQNRVSGKKSLAGAAGAMSPAFAAALAQPTGQVKLASCDVGQFSLELPTLKHGVFTAALLEALRGGAADADGDGLIRLNEVEPAMTAGVAAHLTAYNRDLPEADRIQQSPTFHGPAAARRLPLAVPATDAAVLIEKLARRVGQQGYTAELHARVAAALTAGTMDAELRREAERFADQGGAFFAIVADRMTPAAANAVLTVAADGTGDHRTVAAALAAIPSGGTVRVMPGTYRENGLTIDRSITLEGIGPRAGVIIEANETGGLKLTASAATVRGLTLHCTATPEKKATGLWITAGKPLVEDCAVTSTSISSIAVQGAGTNPTLRNCSADDGWESGLFIFDGAAGTYEGCTFTGNKLVGVEVEGTNTNPTLRRCTAQDGRTGGLLVWKGAGGTYEDCTFSGNKHANIEVAGAGTNPTLKNCAADDGGQSGLFIHDGAAGTYEGCSFAGNKGAGISVMDAGTNPTIHGGEATGNGYEGVWIEDKAQATVTGMDLRGNARGAWDIDATAGTVTRSGNQE